MSKIWVYAEFTPEGVVDAGSLELLTKARSIGDTVEAIALGPGATAAAATLGEYGASTVFASDEPLFSEYLAEPAAHVITTLAAQHQPNLILFATTYDARDVAARVSAKIGSSLLSNANDILAIDRASTQIFGGNVIAEVQLEGADPKLVLVRPKSFAAEPSGGTANITPVGASTVPDSAKRAKRIERHVEEASGPKLEDAKVVVSGGRGLGDPSNFKLVEDLAGLLGGAAGATRAIVDAGWVPYALQVGQTGKTVKPDVYIAVGISGASQHLVGMKDSRKIISINRDDQAPILAISDLGIVGDALKILPKVIDEIRSRKG